MDRSGSYSFRDQNVDNSGGNGTRVHFYQAIFSPTIRDGHRHATFPGSDCPKAAYEVVCLI